MEEHSLSVEEMRVYLLSHPADECGDNWKKVVEDFSDEEVRALYAKANQPAAPPTLPAESED